MKPVSLIDPKAALRSDRSGWPRHLLSCDGLSIEAVEQLFVAAREMRLVGRRRVKKLPTLRGRTIINVFFENSTRTRVSFELAGKRMGADVINFSVSGSSASKGETLGDTARTLDAMNPDLIVVRHGAGGAPWFLAERLSCSVVNAGDGINEHPTQALLDAFTLSEHIGDLNGKRVVIVGDIAHSRVARSNIHLLNTLGAEVICVAPRTMIPAGFTDALPATWHPSLDDLIETADAVMMLRIQRERMKQSLFPQDREYSIRFGMNPERAARLPEHAIIMHPGPINRGVEIDPAVADGRRAVILDQVENGVALRMAIGFLLLGGSGE